MPERWVGFAASGASVAMVDAEIPDDEDEPIIINADQTWRLQKGDRAEAYNVLYQHCANYVRENGIERAVVKGSAVLGGGGMKLAHLEGAEVRGVIIAASASVCPVRSVSTAVISRNYGDRKFDEYLKDNRFWSDHTMGGELRIGSRAAAMMLIAARNG
jgi:hypothetical protein